MHRLYSVAFKRILVNLNATELTPNNINQILQANKIGLYSDYVYHRLARQNLKQFIKTPCPTTKAVQKISNQPNKQQISNQQAIIRISKRLRQSFNVDQLKVCNRCQFKDKCALKGKQYPQNEQISGLTQNSVSTLLLYMQQMQKLSILDKRSDSKLQNENQYRIWKQGYKTVDSVLSLLQDLKNGGNETREFQRIRQQYIADLDQGKIVKKRQQKVQPNDLKKKKQNKKSIKSEKKQKIIQDQQLSDEQEQQFSRPNKYVSKPYRKSYNNYQYPNKPYQNRQRRQHRWYRQYRQQKPYQTKNYRNSHKQPWGKQNKQYNQSSLQQQKGQRVGNRHTSNKYERYDRRQREQPNNSRKSYENKPYKQYRQRKSNSMDKLYQSWDDVENDSFNRNVERNSRAQKFTKKEKSNNYQRREFKRSQYPKQRQTQNNYQRSEIKRSQNTKQRKPKNNLQDQKFKILQQEYGYIDNIMKIKDTNGKSLNAEPQKQARRGRRIRK